MFAMTNSRRGICSRPARARGSEAGVLPPQRCTSARALRPDACTHDVGARAERQRGDAQRVRLCVHARQLFLTAGGRVVAKTNSAGWEQQTAKMESWLPVRVVHYNMTSISSGAVLNVRSFEYR